MPDLSVDLAGLSDLSRTLSSIRSALDATRSLVDGYADDLGSSDVVGALDHFESNWDDGRGQINKNMEAMGEVIDDSVAAYQQTDEELTSSLQASTRETG